MASPYQQEGSLSSTVVVSDDLQVLSESIVMTIDTTFEYCNYEIEYNIEADSVGGKLPLAFVTLDYLQGFEVSVDDVPLQSIDGYDIAFPFSVLDDKERKVVTIAWDKNESKSYDLDELHYYEIDVQQKVFVVKVSYTSKSWIDRSDWLKDYSFRYSLSPAEHWNKFGKLTLVVNYSGKEDLQCNLSDDVKKSDSTWIWSFGGLPGKYLVISKKIEINTLAQLCLWITPEGFGVLFFALFLTLHLRGIRSRNKQGQKGIYFFSIVGPSIIFPFVVFILYCFTYSAIDSLIGEEASRYHGYYFLMIVFYPVFMLLHWIIAHSMNENYSNQFLKDQ